MNAAEWRDYERDCRLADQGQGDPPDIRSGDVLGLRAELLRAKCEVRELRRSLRELTGSVADSVAALDVVMGEFGTPPVERGGRVATIRNHLEFENDRARHFGLGEKFPLKRRKGLDLSAVLSWLERLRKQSEEWKSYGTR